MKEAFLQYTSLHAFFISNIFKSNARLILGKNQANAKQHPEAKLLPSENYWHSSSRYHLTITGHILKISKRTSMSVFMRLCN